MQRCIRFFLCKKFFEKLKFPLAFTSFTTYNIYRKREMKRAPERKNLKGGNQNEIQSQTGLL